MQHTNERLSYFPLILVLSFILLLSTILFFSFGQFTAMEFMRIFMGIFLVVFGSFKLIALKKFVDMYRQYDLVTKMLPAYGYLYPFIELGLGLAFLFSWQLQIISLATAIIAFVSSIGVIQVVKNKTRIRCACLGAVIKLPMSTITVIEDVGMGVMALILFLHLTV